MAAHDNSAPAAARRVHGVSGGAAGKLRPFDGFPPDMIELNPIRQRIADLTGRLDALRGYL